MSDVPKVKRAVRLDTIVREDLGKADRSKRKDDLWWNCPFHEEKDPSFHVTKKDGEWFYRCFGCDASGDVLDWMQQYRGMEFREALEALADRGNVQLSDGGGNSRQSHTRAKPPSQEPTIRKVPAPDCALAAEVSVGGKATRVTMDADGKCACECKRHKPGDPCRHVKLFHDKYGPPRQNPRPPRSTTESQQAERKKHTEQSKPKATIQSLARDKGLPADFLKETFQLEDTPRGCKIPYFLPNGDEARPRLRTANKAGAGSQWLGDSDDMIVPYGLPFKKMAQNDGELIIAEGESDVFTLTYADYAAYGIPGASMPGKINAQDLTGIDTLYVIDEGDSGAETFISQMASRLDEIDYPGRVYVIRTGQDANELWQACGCNVERFRERMEQAKSDADPIEWPEPDPVMFEPHIIAEHLLRYGGSVVTKTGRRGLPLRTWHGKWYEYDGNGYRTLSGEQLNAYISNFIQAVEWQDTRRKGGETITFTESKSASTQQIKNVRSNLQGQCFIFDHIKPPAVGRENFDGHVIACNNGLIHVDQFLNTPGGRDGIKSIELDPTSPEYFIINPLNYDFKPRADCPLWQKTLQLSLPEEAKRSLLQEWAGYCLIPSNRFQKLLALVGEGANGKSVIQDVVKHMIGPHNVTAYPLEQLHERFALSALVGKSLNIAPEWGRLHQTGLANLKAVTGGDAVSVEIKNGGFLEMQLQVRWMVTSNDMPTVRDRSNAFWRRIMILKFEHAVPEEKRIEKPDLMRELKQELPGILNWALIGLHRLMDRGGFCITNEMRIAARTMRESSNPAATFCDDHLKKAPGGCLNLSLIYEDYKKFCRDGGYKHLNRSNFGKEVKRWCRRRHQFDPETKRKRVNGQRAMIYYGVEAVGGGDDDTEF